MSFDPMGVTFHALDASTVNSTTEATVYTPKMGVPLGSTFGMQIVWTGTPTSTITLWVSNKANPDESDDTDWVQDSDFSLPAEPAGSASKTAQQVGNAGARWYRLKIATSGGSGTISVWFAKKDYK